MGEDEGRGGNDLGSYTNLKKPSLPYKTKRNDTLTFVIMSGPDNPVKDFRVSARAFKFCVAFFCIALISFGAVSYYYLHEFRDNKVTIAELAEINEILNDTTSNQEVLIKDLQHIAGNLLQKIEDIEVLNTEVRTKVGLEEELSGETQIVAGYSVSRGDSIDYTPAEGIDEDMDTLEDLKQELLDMDYKMTEQAMELLLLKDDVERQLAFEAALPSLWPMEGMYVSAFGNRRDPITGGTGFHQGIDIANRSGTKILAAGDGIVTFAGYKSGWGRMVMINHGYGYVSQYAHCSTLNVLEGQRVEKGDVIAACGSTGRTTGSHLHFGVQLNGTFIDPMRVLITEGAQK